MMEKRYVDESIYRVVRVLDLIVAEFKSDPMKVQCFDRSTVKEAEEALEAIRAFVRRNARERVMEKRYLGDSVYAQVKGFNLLLTTNNGAGDSNAIYLEPAVVDALLHFIGDIKAEE